MVGEENYNPVGIFGPDDPRLDFTEEILKSQVGEALKKLVDYRLEGVELDYESIAFCMTNERHWKS